MADKEPVKAPEPEKPPEVTPDNPVNLPTELGLRAFILNEDGVIHAEVPSGAGKVTIRAAIGDDAESRVPGTSGTTVRNTGTAGTGQGDTTMSGFRRGNAFGAGIKTPR